jgi:hypothetical protein
MPDWVAIYGAALSTVLALGKAYEYYRDRADVKVKISPGMKATPGSQYGNRKLLFVSVVNVGRRPVSITHVSLRLPNSAPNRYLLCADPATATYPVYLTESQRHGFVFDEDVLRTQYKLTDGDFVAVASDSHGRDHWSHGPIWRLRRFRTLR